MRARTIWPTGYPSCSGAAQNVNPGPPGVIQPAVNSTVTVTVTYQWVSEAYFGGLTLKSTSTMPMSN